MPDTTKGRLGLATAKPTRLGPPPGQTTLPKPGVHVIVQCKGYRCLGYYDPQGKWRNVKTAQELGQVQGWCGIGDDTFTPIAA